jgi:hypothetical protein
MRIEKKIEYTFSDGVKVLSETTSKTSFHRSDRHSYNLHTIAGLVGLIACAKLDEAVEESEREISE